MPEAALSEERRAKLAAYFAAKLGLPATAELAEWRLASQGMSDETIFATLDAGGVREELVIRRFRYDGVARELTDIGRQCRLLRALDGSGVPIAEALWHESADEPLGAPFFVMRRVAGTVPVPWSPEGRKFLRAAGEGAIGEQFVDILTRIHAVDWRSRDLAFLPGAEDGRDFAAHAPPTEAPTLVHGDYRTGNIIYAGNPPDRIAAVLDWEFARIGDPMVDLGWVCARSNRMESDLVCYLLPREAFLASYAERSGRRPDPRHLHFWEIFHQVRNGMIWLSAAEAWASGRTRDLRLARWSMTVPTMRRMILELLEEAEA